MNKSKSSQGGGEGREYLVFMTVSGSVSILLSTLVIHVKRDSRHLSRQLQRFAIGVNPQTLAYFRAKGKNLCRLDKWHPCGNKSDSMQQFV